MNARQELVARQAAIAARPDEPQPHLALADLLMSLSRKAEAEQAYRVAGAMFFNRGQLDAALGCWTKALELKPSAQTLLFLAKAYRKKGLVTEAIAACERALQLAPRNERAYRDLGRLLAKSGNMAQAEALFRRWLDAVPGSVDASLLLADVAKRRGDVGAAYSLLAPLVQGERADVRAVGDFAGVCNRLDPPPAEAVAVLERWATRRDLKPADQARILRGLARLHDALGRYDEAIARMREAREVQSAAFGGDEAKFFGILAGMPQAYTAERLARLPRAKHGSTVPIFIVGMPRSGTTLAEQVIASHPRAFGAGELTHIIRFARVLGEKEPYPACLEHLDATKVNGLAAEYLGRVRGAAPQAERITDKMPFNFLHLGLIELLFPQARVVHCVRNPLDTCISCFFNDFPDGLSIAHDLHSLGRFYRGYVALMRHWKSVLRLPMLELRYEDMVAEPEKQIRSLIDFCGLEWNDACLRFHASKRPVSTSSYHQVSRPIYSSSIGRHRAYERHLAPLRDGLGSELARAAA